MKKRVISILGIVLVIALMVPAASAETRYPPYSRNGQATKSISRQSHGCVGCALIGGLVLGGILGGLVATSVNAEAHSAPPPPPAPRSCVTRGGHWTRVEYRENPWRTNYRDVWVPAKTVCR